jgi:hypothetical protein
MTLYLNIHRTDRTVASSFAALALLRSLGTAQAANFKDKRLEALQDGCKYVELGQVAQVKAAYKRFIANGSANPANPLSTRMSLVNFG